MNSLLPFICLALAGCAASTSLSCPVPDAAVADAAPAPCRPPLVDEGDACVGWRAIPEPPCLPSSLERLDGEVAIHCPDGRDFVLTGASTWVWSDGTVTPITVEDGALPEAIAPEIIATLPDGSRVGTHGDPYALPAAWRTDATGHWRETVAPPSAFLSLGTALSDDEALFVGQEAYVFTVQRR